MRRVHNSPVAFILAALVALAGLVISSPPAQADPGQIPAGPVNFYILGGSLGFGGQVANTLAINQTLPHPDRPPECEDGVDNEVGFYHAWTTNNPTTGTPNPVVGATDGRIDFGTGPGQENATVQGFTLPAGGVQRSTGCVSATDNLELFDRNFIAPNPIDPFAAPNGCVDTGASPNVAPPGCGTNPALGDACQYVFLNVNHLCDQISAASVAFGNGATGQGQEKVVQSATGGTVDGRGAVSVPQANVKFARGYQSQGQCQTQAGITICLDLYVEFSIEPVAPITGQSNTDGSGTVNTQFKIHVNLDTTYDSQDIFNLVPKGGKCTSNAPITLNMTAPSGGSPSSANGANALTGVPYDTFSQNMKVVQEGFTVPAFTTDQGEYGGTFANLCSELNKQLFGADNPAATATNGAVSLIISTQDTSQTSGSSASGTGMPWQTTNPATANGPNWTPVAAAQVATNNGVLSAPTSADTNFQVNEGDLVAIDTSKSYDPAMQPFITNTLVRTGGTANPPPATTGTAPDTVSFVAQDASVFGDTHEFTKTVSTNLGPSNQTESDVQVTTITVNNVPPTANAGPNRTVSGGTLQTLTGTSVDPGDLDMPGERGYCWTQTGGTSVGLPACTGSPANNRPSAAGKWQPLNFNTANANDTLSFSLTVCDNDGGCSSPSSTQVVTRAQSAGTISGVITDAGGSPISGATVNVFNSGGFVATTSTNGSGQYSVSGLAADPQYFVSAAKSGFSTGYFAGGTTAQNAAGAKRFVVNTSTTGRSDIDIALTPTGALGSMTGTVVDSGGGITGMNVRLYDETGFVAQTSTLAGGSYFFTNVLPKSTYKVRFNCVVCGGSLPYTETWFNGALTGNMANLLNVNPGGFTDNGPTTMYKTAGPDQRATISGTVLGLGNPLQSVDVRVYDFATGGWVADVPTNASGNYSLTLDPGSYKVWYWTKNPTFSPPAATTARTSQWFDGLGGFLNGEQGEGTGKLVTSADTLSAGGSQILSPNLP